MEGLSSLIEAYLTLKETLRRGWVLRGVEKPESVAEHTFGVALLSMVIASARGLDASKACAIALVHDLHESVTGDLTPDEKASDESSAVLEVKALEPLMKDLPQKVSEELLNLSNDYVKAKTEEAKLVRNVDKLEMAIQAERYFRKGLLGVDATLEFIDSAISFVDDYELQNFMLDLRSKVVQEKTINESRSS